LGLLDEIVTDPLESSILLDGVGRPNEEKSGTLRVDLDVLWGEHGIRLLNKDLLSSIDILDLKSLKVGLLQICFKRSSAE
jgi:hypothetical protein